MLAPLQATHPIPANAVYQQLANDENFRARIHFEMEDENVVSDGRNINFRPKIPDIPKGIRLFQNDEIKWVGPKIVLTTRYIFHLGGRILTIKSIRTISPDSEQTSDSTVVSSIKRNEIGEEYSMITLHHIQLRHQQENILLSMTHISDVAVPESPFDRVLTEVRNSITELDQLLHSESQIDPSIRYAVSELRELHSDIASAANEIITALRRRDQLAQEIKQKSQEVATAAGEIEQILNEPVRAPAITDTKNDVAFAFSLIPIAITVIGFLLKRG